jgi:signal transduction histidine kinase
MLSLKSGWRFRWLCKAGLPWWYLLFSLTLFSPIAAQSQDDDEGRAQIDEALRHMGSWVWDKTTFDKQSVHLWKSFVIPPGAHVSSAMIYITVDNSYRLLLDGREIGRGSDWKTISAYDVKSLLSPGEHVLGVDAFNDRLAGGLIFGMEIDMGGRPPMEIMSDDSWNIVPLQEKNWATIKRPSDSWDTVVVEGKINAAPWKPWPYAVVSMPPIQPIELRFWQTPWFQVAILTLLGGTMLCSLWLMTQLAAQSKARRFLEVERARIARDIHDDLGAQLTQLVLQGEVAQSEQPSDSPARVQFNQLCERARDISRAMGEVVWAINSRRDTVRDFAAYVCKYAASFLSNSSIRCRLDVEPEIPEIPFDLPTRRNLFLAVKEALNNAAKHSGADELFVRVRCHGERVIVIVEDNGRGFDSGQCSRMGNGLDNMVQRMNQTGGMCSIVSQPGAGCVATFIAKVKVAGSDRWFKRSARSREHEMEIPVFTEAPGPVNAHEQ